MLDTDRFQQTIVDHLKADVPLLAALGTGTVSGGHYRGIEVREDFYQGADWGLPAVRVAIDEAIPIGEPNCKHWRVSFRTYVISEQASSHEAQHLLQLAGEALNLKILSATGSYSGLRIMPVRITPHRIAQLPDRQVTTWYGEDAWNQYVIEKR